MDDSEVVEVLAKFLGYRQITNEILPDNRWWKPHGELRMMVEADVRFLTSYDALAPVWRVVLNDIYINSYDAMRAVYALRYGASDNDHPDYDFHDWIYLMFTTHPADQARALARVIAKSNKRRPK